MSHQSFAGRSIPFQKMRTSGCVHIQCFDLLCPLLVVSCLYNSLANDFIQNLRSLHRAANCCGVTIFWRSRLSRQIPWVVIPECCVKIWTNSVGLVDLVGHIKSTCSYLHLRSLKRQGCVGAAIVVAECCGQVLPSCSSHCRSCLHGEVSPAPSILNCLNHPLRQSSRDSRICRDSVYSHEIRTSRWRWTREKGCRDG